MTGGIICPLTDEATSIAPAFSFENPVCFIIGIVNVPVVTVLATEDPEIIPVIPDPRIAAAILGSGMTGMISGSSVANTVTTGTFTIPIMKQTGFSKEKAGAIEVASSVNGQIMPPVMGAAAFVMASFIGVTYFEIVKHAFLPAIISYIALFYISHLQAP